MKTRHRVADKVRRLVLPGGEGKTALTPAYCAPGHPHQDELIVTAPSAAFSCAPFSVAPAARAIR